MAYNYSEYPVQEWEIPPAYAFQISLTDHPIVRRGRELCYKMVDENLPLGKYLSDYYSKKITREEAMQAYRDAGFSLNGFQSIWSYELDKMVHEKSLTIPIEEIERHWLNHPVSDHFGMARTCMNIAKDLADNNPSVVDEAIEVFRLFAKWIDEGRFDIKNLQQKE